MQMEDELHLSRFSHELPDMAVRPDDLAKVKPQPFDFFLVLDLEGMVEILEFPVLLVDAKTLQVVDRFHRYAHRIRPWPPSTLASPSLSSSSSSSILLERVPLRSILTAEGLTNRFSAADLRFVRPAKMSEERIEDYIRNKYGKWGLER